MGLAAGTFLREAQSHGFTYRTDISRASHALGHPHPVHHSESTIQLTLTGGEFPITGGLPTYSNINCMALSDLLVPGFYCYIMVFGCRNVLVASTKGRIVWEQEFISRD